MGFVVPRVENLQEDPLRPLVKLFVGGAHAAASIVAQTKSAQLTTHIGNVRLGVNARMNSRHDGVLFCRQTKTVVAKCVQHVVASHALVARKHVGGDVTERVAYVQSCARRIRKHVEHKQLFAARNFFGLCKRACRVRRFEGALGVPMVLPFGLDLIGQARGVAEGRNLGFRVVSADGSLWALC